MILSYYKNKFYINICLILLFFAGVSIFIIYPALKEINKVNQEITSERIKLERKLALGLNIKKIINDLDTIEDSAKNLDTIFLEKNSELNFIGNLELIANKYNLNLNITSDFSSQDIGYNISQVGVQIIASGNYKQILQFMAELENQPYYFNLESISFSKNKRADGSTIVSAQLIGHTFFKK